MIQSSLTHARTDVRPAPMTLRSALAGSLTVVVLAIALLWPAMINRGPLIFFDTMGYLSQGRSAVELVADRIAATPAIEPDRAARVIAAEGGERDARFVRSIVYPGFAYIGSLGPLGVSGAALLQALVVAVLVAMIAAREVCARPVAAVGAAVVLVTLTSAPWTASTLMPDVFASIAILCAMIIAARLDRIGAFAKLFVFGAATLAALSHYGHTPLFLAASGAALLALLAQRQLSLWALALTVGPLAATMVASLGVAQAVFDEDTVMPRRLPLLLARSMEDGPALWHLEAHCDEYRYAVCELWDGDIPDNLGALLWSPEGLREKSTDEQMDRIREEELLILRRALMEYPVAQTWSFVGNAVRQMGLIGMGDTSWGRVVEGADGNFQREAPRQRENSRLFALGLAQKAVVLGATGLILFWIVKDGLRTGDRERALLFVAVAGLVANAAIFGGLSAPVDRYQARVIWIIPMLAALFWIARLGVDSVRRRERG